MQRILLDNKPIVLNVQRILLDYKPILPNVQRILVANKLIFSYLTKWRKMSVKFHLYCNNTIIYAK